MNPINLFKAQPRFFTSALAGIILGLLLPHDWRVSTRLLAAWDAPPASTWSWRPR